MQEEEVKKHINKKVLIILRNGFKITTTIPKFSGASFSCVDKYNQRITVECNMVSMITEIRDRGDE